MKKIHLKNVLIVLALLCLLFVAGCTKTAIKEKLAADSDSFEQGVMFAKPAIMLVESAVVYDESTTQPEIYRETYYEEPFPNQHFGSGEDVEVELKIIRNANLELEVDDFFLASQKVEVFAKKYGGYVSNSDSGADHNNKQSGTITLRVPDSNFDAVLAELSLLGNIKSKNINGQDVTEEFVDINTRISNFEAHEARLIKMYENTTTLNEMLNVENELSRVREQIERYEGRLRYLSNRADFSTITVSLYEPQPVVKKWGILDSIKTALNNCLSTLNFLIEFIGLLLPLLLICAVAAVIIVLVKRRAKRSNKITKFK